jgi:hypothetical protein
MADACPQHLPVPSQDTFLWYCAARRREFFRRVAMISYGWRHVAVRHDAGLSRLRNVAHRALASEVPSALSEPAGAQRFATEPLQPSGDEIAATGRANAPYPRQEEAPSPRDVRRDRGIVYLLTGPGHGARLAVSLWSLRRYYQGPVTVYTTRRESHAIGQRCANDRRLCVEHRTATEVARGKNSTFLTKVKLLSQVPYTVAAFLDADTVIAGTIDALLEVSCEQPFCATQFSDWTTSHHLLRNRIDAWRGLSPNRRDAQWLAQFLDQDLPPRPAVNSGVIGFRADAAILGPWYRLAMIGRSTFICEEIALQLLLPHYSHKLLDCRYNCSPIYGVNRGDARIWHLHGEKHLARPEYREIWLPLYQECLRQNIAGLREWTPGGDRQLLRFVEPESDPQGNGNCSPG